jgi:hypothetical protein
MKYHGVVVAGDRKHQPHAIRNRHDGRNVVSRAPCRYSGTREPGTLVMAQLASGTQLPIRAEAERSIRLVAVIATEARFAPAQSIRAR